MRKKIYRLISGFLTAVLLAGTVGAVPAKAAVENGWEEENGNWYWYENGVRQGYDPDNAAYRGKEIYDPGSDAWYWLDNVDQGKKAVSKDVYQESDAGNWAGESDGTGKWVRYDADGHMIKGWHTNENGTYYFDPVYGTMAKGYAVIDGSLHYFDKATGVESPAGWEGLNGWVVVENIDGNCYWYENGVRQGYDPENPAYRGKEIYDPESDAWYWLDNVDQGKKAVSKDVYQESSAGEWAASADGTGKWVRYDAQGHMIKGWSTNENGTYYFDPIYGTMAKGVVTIDGKRYEFDQTTGVLLRALTDGDYEYTEAVVDGLTGSTDYRVEAKEGTEGRVVLPANETTASLKQGDILVLPETAEWQDGLILKISGLETRNGEVRVTGEVPDDPLEVYESVSIQGTAQAELGEVSVEDGVTFRVVENGTKLVEGMESDSMELKGENVTVMREAMEFEIKELSTTVSMQIPEISYDVEYDSKGVKSLDIELPNKIVIKTEASKEFSGEKKLGSIPFKLPAGFSVEVELVLVCSVEGTVSIETRLDNTVGVNYENGKLTPIAECNPSQTVELSADAKAGAKLDVGLYFAKGIREKWDEFTDWWKGEDDKDDDIKPVYNVGAELGVGFDAKLQAHVEVNLTCVDVGMYLYLDLYVGEGSFIGDTFDLKKTWNVWDEDDSPLKGSVHLEKKGSGGLPKMVQQCTYVPRAALSKCTVTLSPGSYTYDGTAKKPAVTVKNGSSTIPGSEYTVSYSNNVNVGTATVTITAKSGSTKVTGSTTKTFTIKENTGTTEKTALSACTVTLSPGSYTYDGTAKKPAVTVKNGSSTIPGSEYTVSYSNNVNVGTATVTITAKSGSTKVTGSTTKTFTIKENTGTTEKTALSACTVTLSQSSYTYDGTAKKPAVTVKNGSSTIPASEYTVSYSNNVNVGTATVTITAKSGSTKVTGSTTKTFTIGKGEQELTAQIGAEELLEGATTTITASALGAISYQSSDTNVVTVNSKGVVTAVSAGTATITVTAVGSDFYDEKSVTFTVTVAEVKYQGTSGEIEWWISTEGKLTVTGSCGPDGTLPHSDWDRYKNEVVSAYIDVDGARDLSGLFCHYENLKNVDLSNLDTSNVTDMSYMFSGLGPGESGSGGNMSLSSVNFGNFDTSNVTNMCRMFYNCSALSSVDLSSFDTGSVTNMFYMFYNCSALSSLDLSSFDTGNVTDMWGMFSNCRSLTSVDLSSFDTGNVTDMRYMFSGCSALSSVDLSSFDTGNVTDMRGMFGSCSSLSSVDLSSFDTGNVTDMRGMFSMCSSLSSVDLSSFDTGSVTNMSNMFYYCETLSSVDLSSFDTGSVTNMSNMFYYCETLSSVDLSSFDTSSVTDMSHMFFFCRVLNSVDLSSFDTGSVKDMSNMFYHCETLSSVDLSSFDTSSVTDMSHMFSFCRVLNSVDLSSFDTGSVKDMSDMFSCCGSLTSVDLSSFDTGSVTNMSNMFSSCGLTSLDLSSFNTGNVTDMSTMFSSCRSLTSLDLSSFDTGNVTNMSHMFSSCGLTSLDLSSFEIGNKTNMEGMFSDSSNLTEIFVGSGWQVTGYCANIFLYCGTNQVTPKSP